MACEGEGRGTCPDGYTCQAFEGFVLDTRCQIRCQDDCECPEAHLCEEVSDKVHTWVQRNPPARGSRQ